MRLGFGKRKIAIWREKAGVIGPTPTWCCGYGYWLHCTRTLPGLIHDVAVFWKSDYRICG